MNKLEMAMELVRRAHEEQKRLEAMNKELEKVGWQWQERFKIEKKYYPLPRKSVINDSIKMARRLLMESYV